MTWTFSGAPGTGTAAGRRDAVRVLVGDTDTNDQQVTDETISFFLSQSGDEVYGAAANTARSIAALYGRQVNTKFEGVSADYEALQSKYLDLANWLEAEGKKQGGRLGAPVAGGISLAEMEAVEADTDRPTPSFRRNQFNNPPVDRRDRRYWY